MPDDVLKVPAAPAAARARMKRVYDKLDAAYPDARCDLDFDTPFQLLCATILSAQCLDATVNRATPALFAAYPDPPSMADATPELIEPLVKTCGFFRNKARSLHGAATGIMDRFGGEVPRTMAELLTLPGVARKTANVVLGNAFQDPRGVTVDTHVGRISKRLGLTDADAKNALRIERDLAALLPRSRWTQVSHLMIWHGRAVCRSQNPRCETCLLRRSCPKIGVDPQRTPTA